MGFVTHLCKVLPMEQRIGEDRRHMSVNRDDGTPIKNISCGPVVVGIVRFQGLKKNRYYKNLPVAVLATENVSSIYICIYIYPFIVNS